MIEGLHLLLWLEKVYVESKLRVCYIWFILFPSDRKRDQCFFLDNRPLVPAFLFQLMFYRTAPKPENSTNANNTFETCFLVCALCLALGAS